jgi:two-component system LytT family sensor kinase
MFLKTVHEAARAFIFSTSFVDVYMQFVCHKVYCVDFKMNRERFADIYRINEKMKLAIDLKRVKFYAWIGFAYLVLWLIIDLGNYPGELWPRFFNNLWRWIYIVPVNFIFFEYAYPFVRKKRKYIFYNILIGFLVLWGMLMICTFGLYAWRGLGIRLQIYTPLREFESIQHAVSYGAPYGIFSILFFAVARHTYDYIKLKQSAQQLRIEKQQAELNYLRSQTNPHFLFNTLNNIYALSRDKSDLAPESILRLSKILRFMLYETGSSYIAIEQEIKIISDYIALEKLRYDDSLRVNFNYDIEDMKQALPPLLLIPLVENAFKHGVSETRSQPYVDIHLSVNKRQLVFLVKNSSEAVPGEMGVKENIGLSNLRRQLELLYTDYKLSVQQGDSAFTARLEINLASHV